MGNTIKINLGGTLFQADEEAYNMLRGYLQEIDNRLKKMPGGAETIEDIELRIAEIFQSQGAAAGVISKENVEAMISILGKPQDFDISEDHPDERPGYSSSVIRKKLFRNPDDKIIGGVGSGMGIYFNTEPVWIRVLFVIFALFGGVGFFVYLALWIALPAARNESMKMEMYGGKVQSSARNQQQANSLSYGNSSGSNGPGTSGLGNVINEIFRAVGRVCYIALRIILILLGLSVVLTGFISLVTVIMIFFFKFPGYFSTHAGNINLFYFPDFLNYVVNPAVAPWIIALAFIIILLPLLAMIYWGVKMIFWFKAKDLIFALAGLVLWVMSIAALSIILFSEGISFSETAKTGTEELLKKAPDELYILSDHKVKDLKYDKEIVFPDDGYDLYFSDDNKGLYITPALRINTSNDENLKIAIRKRSAGRSRSEATERAEGLLYNYRMTGDTLFLDEYFAIPVDRKWAFDNLTVNLFVPEGTEIHFDSNTKNLFCPEQYEESCPDDDYGNESDLQKSKDDDLIRVMTHDGLKMRSDSVVTGK